LFRVTQEELSLCTLHICYDQRSDRRWGLDRQGPSRIQV
jgi:hypothetical protein